MSWFAFHPRAQLADLVAYLSWILEGKPARLSVETFQRYYSKGAGIDIDSEEMECVLANMIYKVCLYALRLKTQG